MYNESCRSSPELMGLRHMPGGRPVRYPGATYAAERLRWVYRRRSRDRRCTLRIPEERTIAYPADSNFCVNGLDYDSLAQLTASSDGVPGLYRDVYGRRVVAIFERFDCFDVFDLMYEDRFYNWYFLRFGDSLARVYYADEGDFLYVTEDVENLEYSCCERLEQLGMFGPGILDF